MTIWENIVVGYTVITKTEIKRKQIYKYIITDH